MQGPTPAQKQQIQANVATMRAAGKPESLVQQYLKYEADAFSPSAPQMGPTPPGAPDESAMKGFGRAVLQHGLMNFGDELGVVDPTKQAAFEKQHKILDFIAKIGGGAVAPIAATLAAPELATVGGGVALGGLAGLLSGAGQQDPNDPSAGQAQSRGTNALNGAAGGVLGGAAGGLFGSAAEAAGPAMVKGAMHEATSPEALAHAAFLGPHGYGAKVAGSAGRAGAKAITNAIKKAVLNKAPAEKAANLFELTQQFGGGSTNLFGAPAAAAAASGPGAGAVGGALGAQAGAAGATGTASPSMFNHAPDQQY